MGNDQIIIYALLGGVIPALLWLAFWLREDVRRPEPKGRLAETFLLGMLAVLIVLPLQKWVAAHFPGLGFVPFFLWALIEEFFKFGAAYIGALRSRDDDEPLDPLIYMITAALGFAALENALFIWNPLLNTQVSIALSTGGLRFLGASLLHVVSSGAIGLALALSFYKSRSKKFGYWFIGLAIAIAIHTAFNLFIVNEQTSGGSLKTFSVVWVGIAILLVFFEKIKTIAPPRKRDII